MSVLLANTLASLFIAAGAAAQETPSLFSNTIRAALQTFEVDTQSSKFEEYRDVPEGVAGSDFRLFTSDPVRVLVTGERIGQDDRRFDLSVEHRSIGIEAFFDPGASPRRSEIGGPADYRSAFRRTKIAVVGFLARGRATR